jgi:hypothetical protein
VFLDEVPDVIGEILDAVDQFAECFTDSLEEPGLLGSLVFRLLQSVCHAVGQFLVLLEQPLRGPADVLQFFLDSASLPMPYSQRS